MWATILQTVITSIVLPLLKDVAFMLLNMFKVRQLRKQQEADAIERAKKAAQGNVNYETTPSDDTFGQSP